MQKKEQFVDNRARAWGPHFSLSQFLYGGKKNWSRKELGGYRKCKTINTKPVGSSFPV